MKKGFTLIELLIVIAIIATILAFAVPNFLGARQRASDTKKKSEAQQLSRALRLYYNDYTKYPADSGGPIYNIIKGCGASGTGNCPCSSAVDFAAGGTGCDVIYMKKLPSDFGTSMYYYRGTNTDDFCLKVPLDNASDTEIAKSQTRCATPCSGKVSGTDYAACAD
ncbi:type II secretion system protein [Candidatus Gottesmanbacteria bacterium]|nr:type II secretion system protein [Candidatus Gottesmanbacteria bacterium]